MLFWKTTYIFIFKSYIQWSQLDKINLFISKKSIEMTYIKIKLIKIAEVGFQVFIFSLFYYYFYSDYFLKWKPCVKVTS